MKLFVMTDLEGVSGVVGRSDGIGNRIENIQEARELLTEEVNATVEGLIRGGADEVMVADGHGGSNSILVARLHPRAQLLRVSGPLFPANWSLDDSFDAAVQIGAHAMMGVSDGFLHHSFNSHGITKLELNDRVVGEIACVAVLCAHYGAPTLLVSGDEAACREARTFLPGVDTVATKRGVNRYSSVDRSPAAVRESLTSAAQRAVGQFADRRSGPFPEKLESPFQMTVHLMCPNLADAAQKAGGERIDYLTVRYEAQSFVELLARRNGYAPGVFREGS